MPGLKPHAAFFYPAPGPPGAWSSPRRLQKIITLHTAARIRPALQAESMPLTPALPQCKRQQERESSFRQISSFSLFLSFFSPFSDSQNSAVCVFYAMFNKIFPMVIDTFTKSVNLYYTEKNLTPFIQEIDKMKL